MQLTLVTPTRKLFEGMEVSEVTLPGQSGQLQVLPTHTELMTTLRPGILNFKATGSAAPQYVAISFGYAEIQHDQIVVLAHTAENQVEIDLARAEKALQKAQETLGKGVGHDEFMKYELKWHRAQVRMEIARLKDRSDKTTH